VRVRSRRAFLFTQAAALEGVGALWKGLLPRLVLKSLGSSLWYAVYMAAREAFRSAFQTT
jgi:hypothetical protein